MSPSKLKICFEISTPDSYFSTPTSPPSTCDPAPSPSLSQCAPSLPADIRPVQLTLISAVSSSFTCTILQTSPAVFLASSIPECSLPWGMCSRSKSIRKRASKNKMNRRQHLEAQSKFPQRPSQTLGLPEDELYISVYISVLCMF